MSGLNIRKPPFDDIRVRQAMQMALDRDAIIDSYYGGYAQRDPSGLHRKRQWARITPHSTSGHRSSGTQYRFNPEKAEQLLDEAGYQRGVDGVRFRGHLRPPRSHRLRPTSEIASGYWKEIGVEVEINLMETTARMGQSPRPKGLYEMITGDASL